ncbi:MAG: oxidoreductase [Proteobacteria bacterium]|nr:oxidoreductase [Pseudomonadota bacterium]MBU1710948.1 oxidoreductase [Pseudomonadota bacterium]
MMHLDAPFWIVCPVILPISAALLCFISQRRSPIIALTAASGNILAAGILFRHLSLFGARQYMLGNWPSPLGISLNLDAPALLMLAMTAVTGLGITLYARGYFLFRLAAKHSDTHKAQEQYFWPLWMMLLAALNALFLSNDIFNLYVTLELLSISAVALAALSRKPASQIAAFRYLLVSLLGSTGYLLGVALLYKFYGVLDLSMLRELITSEPGAQTALVLISVGLLLKTAVFPLHFWLPPTHANALAPVSAILSGLVVKASFYLMFRLWFDVFTPVISPQALNLMGIMGAGAILWGAVQAMRQTRLKLLIAYSTVSQLGYLFIAFPLVRLDSGPHAWNAVILMAMAHACAKSAMFMAAGTISLHFNHDRINDLTRVREFLPMTVFAYGIAGANLMGIPPSGGFIAKWLLLTSSFNTSQWWWGLIVIAGSLLAAAYVFKVISRLFVVIPSEQTLLIRRQHSASLEFPALAMAIISMLMGILYPYIDQILSLEGTFKSAFIAGGIP